MTAKILSVTDSPACPFRREAAERTSWSAGRAFSLLRVLVVVAVVFGCAAMGVWIGNIIRKRTRLPPFRIRRQHDARSESD